MPLNQITAPSDIPEGSRFFVWCEDDSPIEENYYSIVITPEPAVHRVRQNYRGRRQDGLGDLNAMFYRPGGYGSIGFSWIEITREGFDVVMRGYRRAVRLDPEFARYLIHDSKPFNFLLRTTHKIGVPKGRLP